MKQNKTKNKKKTLSFTFPLINIIGARYFDQGIFPQGDGQHTPLGHPSLEYMTEVSPLQEPQNPFGYYNFPSAQDVSDVVFNINNTDSGNSGKVPHLYMTFGQLLDHDFASVPFSFTSGCKAR